MANVYSVGTPVAVLTGVAGAAATYLGLWELRTSALANARVLELSSYVNSGNAVAVGLGRPAAIGITPRNALSLVAENPDDGASLSTIATQWLTAPTAPANYFRRTSAGAATRNQSFFWAFPKGIVVPSSASVVMANLANVGTNDASLGLDVVCRINE